MSRHLEQKLRSALGKPLLHVKLEGLTEAEVAAIKVVNEERHAIDLPCLAFAERHEHGKPTMELTVKMYSFEDLGLLQEILNSAGVERSSQKTDKAEKQHPGR